MRDMDQVRVIGRRGLPQSEQRPDLVERRVGTKDFRGRTPHEGYPGLSCV